MGIGTHFHEVAQGGIIGTSFTDLIGREKKPRNNGIARLWESA
jgi:hypothetical protein